MYKRPATSQVFVKVKAHPSSQLLEHRPEFGKAPRWRKPGGFLGSGSFVIHRLGWKPSTNIVSIQGQPGEFVKKVDFLLAYPRDSESKSQSKVTTLGMFILVFITENFLSTYKNKGIRIMSPHVPITQLQHMAYLVYPLVSSPILF